MLAPCAVQEGVCGCTTAAELHPEALRAGVKRGCHLCGAHGGSARSVELMATVDLAHSITLNAVCFFTRGSTITLTPVPGGGYQRCWAAAEKFSQKSLAEVSSVHHLHQLCSRQQLDVQLQALGQALKQASHQTILQIRVMEEPSVMMMARCWNTNKTSALQSEPVTPGQWLLNVRRASFSPYHHWRSSVSPWISCFTSLYLNFPFSPPQHI